jgi:transposase-like protein
MRGRRHIPKFTDRAWQRRCASINRLLTPARGAVAGIFPNENAIVRLVGAMLLKQNDEWAVQRARYMTLETISNLSDDSAVSLPAIAN